MKKKLLPFLTWVLYMLAITLIALELLLRFFFAPTQALRGEKVPLVYGQSIKISYPEAQRVPKEAVHRKNALGFCGEEKGKDFDQRLSLVTIGGSTTNCLLLPDTLEWPYVLKENLKEKYPKIWLNNAGIDGHSSFGHLVLVEEHILPLHPQYALFLVGINDIERGDLQGKSYQGTWIQQWSKYSRAFAFCYAIRQKMKGSALKFRNLELNFAASAHLSLDDAEIYAHLEKQKQLLPAYKERLTSLIALCQKAKISPIFMTQPTLAGIEKDPSTGINFSDIQIIDGIFTEKDRMNGKLYLAQLELYNQTLRDVCAENQIPLIDLAKKMPQDSRYYYDFIHYTADGASKVAEIVAEEICLQEEN